MRTWVKQAGRSPSLSFANVPADLHKKEGPRSGAQLLPRVLSSNAYKAVAEGADVRQTASPSTSVQMTSLVAVISPVFRGPRCIRRVHPDLLELPRVLT
jgi:hypothetical protein